MKYELNIYSLYTVD